MTRCAWVEKGNRLYEHYHDTEWGVPVYDDKILFEFLVLEGAQASLSWLTILKRREGFKKAFAEFDVKKVANFSENDIELLLNNQDIIRNRAKIKSAVNNAQKFLEVQKEFGSFSNYQWQFVGGKPKNNRWVNDSDIPATTPQAEAFSNDLKSRGFTFVGPTIVYAHMQATGMVNDHIVDCFRCSELS